MAWYLKHFFCISLNYIPERLKDKGCRCYCFVSCASFISDFEKVDHHEPKLNLCNDCWCRPV